MDTCMIRMIQSTSVHQAKNYFSQSLSQSDYYLSDQEQPGQFLGQLAKRFNLGRFFEKKLFFELCENHNPMTGGQLTPRHVKNRRVGYDINFHVPKSVSILHILCDDTHILDAFRESVRETMHHMECYAETRVRKGLSKGSTKNRQTGELVWGEFIHQTARPVKHIAPDPHLHCHCFTFNVTWDSVEKRYKAAELGNIKRNMPYYQAYYHKTLSDKLITLGYDIRRTDTAFEVVGVPQAAIDLYSKRTDQIGRLAQDRGITDPVELDKLGARSRGRKQKGLSMQELKTVWRKQISDLKLDPQESDHTIIRHHVPKHKPLNVLATNQSIDYAVKQRFERASVCDERRLLEAALRYAIGDSSISTGMIQQSFDQNDRIIRVRDQGQIKCSTKQVLAEERRMVDLAQNSIGSVIPFYPSEPLINLTGGQAAAVKKLLVSSDRVFIIQGHAGTGKTTLMKEAVRLIESSGSKVMVVAPTSDASRSVLRTEGFEQAETVAKLLTSPVMQKELQDSTLWVDEAGLLGITDMTILLSLTEQYNARLILSGDVRQHNSVARGDALRILSTLGGIRSATISKIYRQRNSGYKNAVKALSDGDIKTGFESLQKMDAIKQILPGTDSMVLVDHYVATIISGRSALVVSPTHKECEQVTNTIRQRLKDAGLIDQQDMMVNRLINLNMTEAEREDNRSYKIGHVIQFSQHANGFKRGSKWVIDEINQTEVLVSDDLGNRDRLPLNLANRFDVFVATEIPVAKSDTMRISRNGFDVTGQRLNNGQQLEVVGFEGDGTITLKNSVSGLIYELPKDYGHLAHAYCTTSHASQGKTVDEVFIHQPASTFVATDRKQFYVSVSRGRDAVHVYTDDVGDLLKAAMNLGDRLSAMELLAKRKNATQQRAEDIARDLSLSPVQNSQQLFVNHIVRQHEPTPI